MTTTSEMFLLCIGTSSIGSLLCAVCEKNKKMNNTESYFTHTDTCKLNFNRQFDMGAWLKHEMTK